MLYAIILLVSLATLTQGFMPDKFSVASYSDYNNDQLTRSAIFEASAHYMERVKLGVDKSGKSSTEILIDYFQDDVYSLNRYISNAVEIGQRVSKVKRDWPRNAARNMNGERIVQCNSLLQAFKTEIIQQLNGSSPNVERARDLVAAYLYTLQEFYSNTNWVEMKGRLPYNNLGDPGVPIMAVADKATSVCKSCSNYDGSPPNNDPDACKSNLLRSDILTSGYKSGQTTTKPLAPESEADEGKCSHGGSKDSSRLIVATGGINKETSNPKLSPHYHLHYSAGLAAHQASFHFFFGKDTSLVNLIPNERFEGLLSLFRGSSIVFVVDDTGSMADEIAGVRTWTINKVAETAGTSKAPYDYILSTFNDPAVTAMSTRDPDVMIAKLQTLNAHGGGDCPEMAMSGLIAALKLGRPFSTVFVFTDAPAKDFHLLPTVMNLATQTNARIYFLLTPACSRKKRDVSEIKRSRSRRASGTDLYTQIARETGGNVYFTTDAGFQETLVVVDESLSGNSIELIEKAIDLSSGTSMDINVDKQIYVLSIELSGATNIDDATLYYPNGTEETFSETNDTKSMISSSMIVMKKTRPVAGTWKLEWKVGLTGSVFVRGNGEITFSYTFRETGEDGILYPIDGQPISGREYFVAVEMDTSTKIQSLDYLFVLGERGNIIDEIKITTNSNDSFMTNLMVKNKPFMLAVNGSDTSGFPFIRQHKKLVTPLSIKMELLAFAAGFSMELELLSTKGSNNHGWFSVGTTCNYTVSQNEDTDDFVTEESLNVTFRLTNVGGSSAAVTVKLSHPSSVTSVKTQQLITVEANTTAEGFFEITAGTSQSLAEVKLESEISGNVVQEVTRQLLIIDPYAPVCATTSSHNCEQLLESNCASANWTATFTIFEKGFGFKRLFTSGDSIQFDHDDFTSGYKGTVNGTISASCCSNSVTIHGEDLAGSVGSCYFSYAFRTTTTTTTTTTAATTTTEHEKPETVTPSARDDSFIIGLSISAALCVAFVAIIAGCTVAVVCKRKNRNKRKAEQKRRQQKRRKEHSNYHDYETDYVYKRNRQDNLREFGSMANPAFTVYDHGGFRNANI